MLKKFFLPGLAILLPVAVTLWLIQLLVGMLTAPFVEIVDNILFGFRWTQHGFLFFSSEQFVHFLSQVLIVTLFASAIVLFGFIAQWLFLRQIFKIGDYILHKIPIVRSVYKTSQDVINTLFAEKSTSFKKVVLVPFPSETSRSIGLVTKEAVGGKVGGGRTAVFIPTTPNPISGFLMFYGPDDIAVLDMTVEDALKYVISCGVISSDLVPLPTKQKGK